MTWTTEDSICDIQRVARNDREDRMEACAHSRHARERFTRQHAYGWDWERCTDCWAERPVVTRWQLPEDGEPR